MTYERWEEIKEHIKGRFEIIDEKTEDLLAQTAEGPVKQGVCEILIAHTSAGKIKLVCEIRPKILEKKFHYTHQQGKSAEVQYVLSDTEKTYQLRLYRWDDREEDWSELSPENTEGLL